MLSDTVIQQAEYEVSGSFDVEFRANMTGLYHPTEGIKLSSYIRVTPKYNAQVLLSTEENEPLYVYWTSGNGKAAVMTSSLSGGNDSAYFTQNEGQKLLISMIEQLMPEESFADAFEVYITGGGSTCTLNVLCPTLENAYHVSVLLTTPMGNQYKLDLPQVRKHMFEKTISVEGYGKYACSLTVSDADYEIVCSHEAAAVLLWSPEYEAFPDEQQKNKLNEICALSGGVVYSDISALLEAEQTKQSIEYNPTNELVLIALFSVCLALFSRKLQDFKKHHIAR